MRLLPGIKLGGQDRGVDRDPSMSRDHLKEDRAEAIGQNDHEEFREVSLIGQQCDNFHLFS
jgi:hypothetical protein